MTQYVINIGALPNDGTGDPLRTAFNETNLNFNQIFAAGPVLSNIQIANNKILTTNTNGNLVLAPNGTGVVQSNVHIVPNQNRIRNLGSPSLRWDTIYVQYANIGGTANISGNINAGSATFSGDLYVDGNLTVEGTTTTIDSTVVDIKDKNITLAFGSPNAQVANGGGITIAGANAQWYYNYPTNSWKSNITITPPNITFPDGTVLDTANTVHIGQTPIAKGDGNLWFNSDDGRGYVKYNNQWIEFSPTVIPNPATYLGNLTIDGAENSTLYFPPGGNIVFGDGSVQNTAFDGNSVNFTSVASSIIPAANVTYSLGNSTRWWTNAWFSSNTIYVGGTPIGTSGNTLTVNGADVVTANASGTLNAANISVTGNITGSYIIGNGSQLTGLPAGYSNSDATTLLANFGSNTISTTGNITAGNLFGNGAGLTNLTAAGSPGEIQLNVGNSIGTDDTLRYVDNGGEMTLYADYVTTGGVFTDIISGDGSNVSLWAQYGNSWRFNTDGSVTFPSGAGFVKGDSGQLKTNDGNTVTLDFRDASGRGFYTNSDGYTLRSSGSKNWVFGTAGDLSAPGNITAGNIIATANVLGNGYAKFSGSFDESQASTAGLYLGYAGGTSRIMFGTGNTSQTFEIDNDSGTLRFYQPGATKASLTSDGAFSAVGNVTGNYILGNVAFATGIPTTYGNANLANIGANSISTTGNISAGYLFGNASQLTGLPATYGNADVASLLASFGSNAISTTGNVSAGNVTLTANIRTSGQIQSTAFTGGNISWSASNQTDFQGSIKLGGLGRILSPGGAASIETNNNGANIPQLRVTSAVSSANTTSGGLIVAGGAGIAGNVYIGGIANVAGNINGSGATFSGNVTAQNFIGNISITGNVQGTSSNVTLVAGSYSYTFDQGGTMTLPAGIDGNEGGEIAFTQAANSTLAGNTVVLDQYVDRIRFFEGGGNARGVYIDMTQAANGVGTLLNNRVSGIVDAGVFVTMDLLKATVTTSGNRGLSLAATTGSFNINISGTYGSSGGSSGTSGTATITTTPSGSQFNWNFVSQADGSTYIITDTTNNRAYRVTLQIGGSFLNNMISIERLI